MKPPTSIVRWPEQENGREHHPPTEELRCAFSLLLGAVSLFFVFYTVRLLIVTHGLQQTRAGGQGAFIGAVVFPLIAIGCGWASRVCWRRATRAT